MPKPVKGVIQFLRLASLLHFIATIAFWLATGGIAIGGAMLATGLAVWSAMELGLRLILSGASTVVIGTWIAWLSLRLEQNQSPPYSRTSPAADSRTAPPSSPPATMSMPERWESRSTAARYLKEELQELLTVGVQLKDGMPSPLSAAMQSATFRTKLTTEDEIRGWEEQVRLALSEHPLRIAQFDAERQGFDLNPMRTMVELPATIRLRRRLENLERIINNL